MKTIRYIDNGKGGKEAVPLKSTQGLVLSNANGDISQTSTGFQIAIDTLTYIRKQIVEQKFYEFDINELVPWTIGEGAFNQNILTNLSFLTGGDFEEGYINTGTSSSKVAESNAAVASKTQKVRNWAKRVSYTLVDIEQALAANNWDLIAAKHRARKKEWDLGIQRQAMIGSVTDNTNFPGLLTLGDATVDPSSITEPLSGMTAAEFNTFVKDVIGRYYANTNNTVLPNRFVIPMSDYLGLGAAFSETYPNVSKLKWLEDTFAVMCPGMKIIPNAFCEATNNKTVLNVGTGYQCYALYRHDPESILFNMPVDYTVTQPATSDNFTFQDMAYGQFTGVGLFRNLEMYYMRY